MKSRLILLIGAILVSHICLAQQRTFASANDAVKFINEMCNKYWMKNTSTNEISREINVYQQGCNLYFNEKSITGTKSTIDSPAKNQVNSVVVSVNLSKVKQSGNYTKVEFTGGKKDIITQSYRGNSQLNNKADFGNRYQVPLDYGNQLLKDNVYDMTVAIDFLMKGCHGKPVKKTHKKRK